ncbi:phosphate ABC transporter substrate-binding protein, PhoT family (TC 3.A.1.7.1) [Halogranum rubrum]|nr:MULTISPECIES: substrate-binding domain-containing protein [Halogranum]SFK62748.1 phosphate ABC transporter substrate-binding protein, PhoT family (TC 3.A.1.7.1) [Halogranum rubrum]
MARDSERQDESATRRKFLLASGAAGVTALAGCSGSSSEDGGSGESSATSSGGESTEEAASGETETQSSSSSSPLTADGSSTVYPITSDGGSVWNSNPPADDEEYWGPGQYDIDTDKPLADYWAGLYGFEPGSEGQPPFFVNVGLSHSGTGVEKVMNGQVDIGDSSAPVEDELPERDSYEQFVDHVVGVDGQPIVVSKAIKDAGVTKLTGDQLRQIYKGEITNWNEVGGPDREIQALGRAEGSGTDTAFRANLYDDPEASMPGIDGRYGQNQQLQQAIANSDNAIGYIALAFVQPDGAVPPIALELEGTTYEYGKNLGAKGYPLSRDLHCYTWEGTSKKESAFLAMLLSEFGQTNFVEPNNYFKLPPERREEEMAKLAEQSN